MVFEDFESPKFVTESFQGPKIHDLLRERNLLARAATQLVCGKKWSQLVEYALALVQANMEKIVKNQAALSNANDGVDGGGIEVKAELVVSKHICQMCEFLLKRIEESQAKQQASSINEDATVLEPVKQQRRPARASRKSRASSARTGASRPNFPKEVALTLKKWFNKHRSHPYPTDAQKEQLCAETGLTKLQLNNWFVSNVTILLHLH